MSCFQSAYSTTCMLVSLRCLRGNKGAQWKDKFTDDHELWPHAISRHQSRESTMLRLEKKKNMTRGYSCSIQVASVFLILDGPERTSQNKSHKCVGAAGAAKPKELPQETHCSALGVKDISPCSQ